MHTKILLFAFIFALVIPGKLLSQNLPDSFITAQFSEYKLWMQNTGLASYISCDTLLQENSEVTLYLGIKGLKNWQTLSGITSGAHSSDLAQVLYDRLLFQLDKARSRIIVDAQDALILIDMKDKLLHTDIRRTLGAADFPKYAVSGLKNINEYSTYNSKKKLNALRNDIKKELKNYFKKFETRFNQYVFVEYSDNDSTMSLEIGNVTKAILQESFFEHIDMDFSFTSRPNGTDVSYRMTAKYASGLIWSPNDARYRPVTPKYQDRFDRFSKIMGSKIFQLCK